MNIDDLKGLLSSHGICEKLDDFDNKGLPDLILFSGGHAVFIFTEWTEQQQYFAKRISHQLAPYFIWRYLVDVNAIQEYDSSIVLMPYEMKNSEDVVSWLNYIEEENNNFDYLAKYS